MAASTCFSVNVKVMLAMYDDGLEKVRSTLQTD